MRHLFGLAVLAVFPAVARADMSIPGFTPTERDLILRFEGEPGYAFFLVSARGAERVPLAPGQPARIEGKGRRGSHRVASLVAVPGGVLPSLDGAGPTEKWLETRPKGVLRSVSIDFRTDLPFYDLRDRVVDTYRVELGGDTVRLVLIEGDPRSLWVNAAAAAFAVGVVWFGVWAARRVFARPRPVR